MNVRHAGAAILLREPRAPWRGPHLVPAGPVSDADRGVLHVFGVGPVPQPGGARSLYFGWMDGKLEWLERVPESCPPGARAMVLGPGLPRPGGRLPAQVRDARALAALELAWAPVLRDGIAP